LLPGSQKTDGLMLTSEDVWAASVRLSCQNWRTMLYSQVRVTPGLNQYSDVRLTFSRLLCLVFTAELPHLEVSVSILHSFEQLPPDLVFSFEIGKHGIIVELDPREVNGVKLRTR
jgi:hypothetical protein